MKLRYWRKGSRKALEAQLEQVTKEKELAFEHLHNMLLEFYKVWDRHEGKNKASSLVHNANQFVFVRDGGKLGEELRQRKIDKKEEIWKQGNGICYLCNKPLNPANWTIDHVVPISKGGGESLQNLMPTHRFCNENKADRIIGPGGVLYQGDPWT